jgi:carbon-monoxide dehydrogenase medium subunit
MKLRLAGADAAGRPAQGAGARRRHQENGNWRIGAMTRHVVLQDSHELGRSRPWRAARDQHVRNRGTIGGSLAHGDPASDLTTAFLAYEGTVTATGPGGPREIAATEFFQDYLTTALARTRSSPRSGCRGWRAGPRL